MEAPQVRRLQEEQEKAIQTTNDDIDKWKKLKNDYKDLSDRLLTLPNKITHEVMVPFGRLAFMPGQLVHTNEILVLLGDNWFVERSAKQAVDIVKRRNKAIENQLEDLQLQKNLLVNRTSFTDEIHNISKGKDDIVEINVKYDEEKEREWKVQHKKNVKKYHEELNRKKVENPESNQNKQQGDQQIWERLDELEKLEAEQSELDDKDAVGNIQSPQEESHHPQSADKTPPSQRKRTIRWVDEEEKDSDGVDSSGSSESEENTQDSKGTRNRENLGMIYFTHTSVQPCLATSLEETSKVIESHLRINSPTDIYKYFVKKSPATPKSILKSPSFEGKLHPESIPPVPVPVQTKNEHKTIFQREKAFNDEVVEKVSQLPAHQNVSSFPDSTRSEQPKKVSKFKASRLQR